MFADLNSDKNCKGIYFLYVADLETAHLKAPDIVSYN